MKKAKRASFDLVVLLVFLAVSGCSRPAASTLPAGSTGTTKLAGHCLVTSNHRDGDHLLMAVLGSSGKASRYTDTQNLYRWAWLERGHKKDK